MWMKIKIHTLFFTAVMSWLMLAAALQAQDITVTATVDRTRIGLNQQFQLTVEISGPGAMNASEPQLPNIENFAAFSGSSTSQNFQFINGRMQVSKSYTYYFIAAKVGTFEIGPVTVSYKGKTYRSAPIRIEIVKSAAPPTPTRPRSYATPRRPQPSTGSSSLADNLFLRAEVSKTRVYLNEPIIINYKIYTNVQVTDYRFTNQPNYGNFWAEEFPVPNQPRVYQEPFNGRMFSVASIKKVALFPTSIGKKVIPPLSIEANVRVRERRRSRDFFDAFFDDPFFGRIISYPMSTDSITVEVLPLPQEGRPRDFNGAVGQYEMDVIVDRKRAKTNEAITLKLTLSGTGNIRTLAAPKIRFPDEFEVYDPKISENVTRANDAIRGYKTFEYVLIPRRPGSYTIQNLNFSYFDPEAEKYITLRHPAIRLTIDRGDEPVAFSRSGLSKEEVRLLSQDIRYIAKTADRFVDLNRQFYHLPAFWTMLIAPALLLLVGFVYRRHQDRLASNVAYARSRKAQKIAQKLLHEARKAMNAGDVAKFYAETAKALTTFVGNKLNLEESALVSDELIEHMQRRGVAGDIVEEYRALLADCDFHRFARPDAPDEAMRKTYEQAKTILARLEKAL